MAFCELHYFADSRGKCNRRLSKEYLMRGRKAQCFTGAMIEPLHHLFDSFVCDGCKIGALRKILAHQTVGVLIEAPLPRGIGMRKIEVRLERGGDLLMARKLSPIVGGDGVHVLRQWFQ